MVSVVLILCSIGVCAVSGLPAYLFSRRTSAGQKLTTAVLAVGCAAGLAGTVRAFLEPAVPSFRMPWLLPWGEFSLRIDSLSAVFLILVFTVPLLGSVYGLGYWKQSEHPDNGHRLGFFYGLLCASMALVTIARDGVLFLIAWEIMAVSAYFASNAEDHESEVRKAGWIYLVATHIGTLCLIAMFTLWRSSTGSFSLDAAGAVKGADALFLLAVTGFGFKAGIMPLHVWLPGAHANAPSHVSAVMSGVMLKIGIYGIVRMTGLLGTPPLWWGGMLLAAGSISCIVGIAFAVSQSDMKRVLAYSSIENIGIITLGTGLALLGRASGRIELVLLGLGGALLHVWNHGLFKPLLFFGAGSVMHETHTRNMNLLGGLTRNMPFVSGLFLTGAIAASALPPLGGFVSEWLLYLGMFRTLEFSEGMIPGAITAAALAMAGAIAVACFVKLYGTVFLGEPRTSSVHSAHDPSPAMTVPMTILAVLCFAAGLFPGVVLPVLDTAVAAWIGPDSAPSGRLPVTIGSIAPVWWITAAGAAIIGLTILIGVPIMITRRARKAGSAGTWDCGYARPGPRMQYTGSSFGQSLVRIFRFFLVPRKYRTGVDGIFPGNAKFAGSVPDAVLTRLVLPFFSFFRRYLPGIRIFQAGRTHLYILYILLITVILLVFGAGIPS